MDELKVAKYWSKGKESKENKDIICELCPQRCIIPENTAGKCSVRLNLSGSLMASSYGDITSIALDPIEKKPLYEFYPGKKIVSIGSYGCNLHCPFCQNYTISVEHNCDIEHMTPEVILEAAKQSVRDGNIGVAYTYNEPLIGYEFVLDCSKLIREAGLKNVLVTNGYINQAPLIEMLNYIDAMNIDIKGNTKRTYDIVKGTPEHAKKTVELSYGKCHVEVTTLVIADENEDEIEDIAIWLASIDPKIPYHLSRFYPRYKYKNRQATPVETMYKVMEIAERHLKNVYLGNV